MLLHLFTCTLLISIANASSFLNSTLHHHYNPEAVVQELQRQVSFYRRRAMQVKDQQQCLTGNPIDDCWLCSGTDWRADRQLLADCGIGFGRGAIGGKGGPIYVVKDPSNSNSPGTLRYGATQQGPLWITFTGDMTIHLSSELHVTSFKTIDARGVNIHVAGGPCLTLQSVSNVIIHGIHIHECTRTSDSDGDGITVRDSRGVWVDHGDLSNCADGLIDVTRGSTGVTISNNHFSRHDKVMLLGHVDGYKPDAGMQVSVAFNRFGQGLVQRMPRCRMGYFHVVNNDYTGWGSYAVGGSSAPTINSQGNRYIAPEDGSLKEVTKRMDTSEGEWKGWDWRSDGDVMVNGAFFVPSGDGAEVMYGKATSMPAQTAALIDQITRDAGVLSGDRLGEGEATSGGNRGPGISPPGDGGPIITPPTSGGGVGMTPPSGGGEGGMTSPNGWYGYTGGMVYGSAAAELMLSPKTYMNLFLEYCMIILFYLFSM